MSIFMQSIPIKHTFLSSSSSLLAILSRHSSSILSTCHAQFIRLRHALFNTQLPQIPLASITSFMLLYAISSLTIPHRMFQRNPTKSFLAVPRTATAWPLTTPHSNLRRRRSLVWTSQCTALRAGSITARRATWPWRPIFSSLSTSRARSTKPAAVLCRISTVTRRCHRVDKVRMSDWNKDCHHRWQWCWDTILSSSWLYWFWWHERPKMI